MKIQDFISPQKADHPDVPEPVQKLIEGIVTQVDDLTTMAQGRTDENNIAGESRTLEVENDDPIELELQNTVWKSSKPTKAELLFCSEFNYAHLAWEVVSQNKVRFKVKVDGLVSGDKFTVTVWFRP